MATRERRGARLGVLGAGVMGERVALAAEMVGFEVAAIAELDGGRRTDLADRFPGAAVVPAWESALGDVELDAVYVGLPHRLHADAACAALGHGVAVLLDKPLAVTRADADRIVAAADGATVPLMVGFSHRYHTELRTARDVIATGELGSLLLATDIISDSSLGTPRWYWDRTAGGGIVHLQMHHSFDRLAWLVGSDIVRVHASVAERDVAAGAVDVSVALSLSFADGTIGTSAGSFAWRYDGAPVVELAVFGETGHVRIETWQSIDIQTTGRSVLQRQQRDEWLDAELAEFRAVVVDGVAPSADARTGWRALEVALAVLESSATGNPVEVRRV